MNNLSKRELKTNYPVLVDDIDDHDELPVVFSVVDKSHSPYLDVSLENLYENEHNLHEHNKCNKKKDPRDHCESEEQRGFTIFFGRAETLEEKERREAEEEKVLGFLL